MDGPDLGAAASVVAKRRDCLEPLLEEPLDKRELADRLGAPRSTLDRAVRELESAGLVAYTSGGYRITAYGRTVLSAFEAFSDALADVCAAEPVLQPLSQDCLLDRGLVLGADVVESSPYAPDDVVSRLVESVSDASSVRGVAPVALTGHLDSFDRSVVGGGGSLEMVVSPAVFSTLVRVRTDRLLESIESGEATIYRGPVPFRFGVWLVDDREVGVVVYTDTGVRGVVVNDSDAAMAWAEDLYEQTKADADPVDAADVRAAAEPS
jgi:predicted transcriptional regulator